MPGHCYKFKERDQGRPQHSQDLQGERKVGTQRKVFQEESSRYKALRQVYISELFKDHNELLEPLLQVIGEELKIRTEVRGWPDHVRPCRPLGSLWLFAPGEMGAPQCSE